MSEVRRQYEPEFREGAVRIVRETGKSIAEVARDLDVLPQTLGNWVKKDQAEREGAGGLAEDGVVHDEVLERPGERRVMPRPGNRRDGRPAGGTVNTTGRADEFTGRVRGIDMAPAALTTSLVEPGGQRAATSAPAPATGLGPYLHHQMGPVALDELETPDHDLPAQPTNRLSNLLTRTPSLPRCRV